MKRILCPSLAALVLAAFVPAAAQAQLNLHVNLGGGVSVPEFDTDAWKYLQVSSWLSQNGKTFADLPKHSRDLKHHLLYFGDSAPGKMLLPDGTPVLKECRRIAGNQRTTCGFFNNSLNGLLVLPNTTAKVCAFAHPAVSTCVAYTFPSSWSKKAGFLDISSKATWKLNDGQLHSRRTAKSLFGSGTGLLQRQEIAYTAVTQPAPAPVPAPKPDPKPKTPDLENCRDTHYWRAGSTRQQQCL